MLKRHFFDRAQRDREGRMTPQDAGEEGKEEQSQRIGIEWESGQKRDHSGRENGGYKAGMTSVPRRDQTRKRSHRSVFIPRGTGHPVM